MKPDVLMTPEGLTRTLRGACGALECLVDPQRNLRTKMATGDVLLSIRYC